MMKRQEGCWEWKLDFLYVSCVINALSECLKATHCWSVDTIHKNNLLLQRWHNG